MSFFKAIGEFAGVFGGSFLLGSAMGLVTALVSFHPIRDLTPKLYLAVFYPLKFDTLNVTIECFFLISEH